MLSGFPRPVHRRYPDLTEAEWVHAERTVAYLVAVNAGVTLGDPRDVAIEAVRRAYLPAAPAWDRAHQTLASYLATFTNVAIPTGSTARPEALTPEALEAELSAMGLGNDDPRLTSGDRLRNAPELALPPPRDAVPVATPAAVVPRPSAPTLSAPEPASGAVDQIGSIASTSPPAPPNEGLQFVYAAAAMIVLVVAGSYLRLFGR